MPSFMVMRTSVLIVLKFWLLALTPFITSRPDNADASGENKIRFKIVKY